MYRMLIVDDEPYITDALVELMAASEHELDLYRAYNGKQALEIASEKKMDIILCDIEMIDITGLEIQEQINRMWTGVQIIFLTGYNYFEYAHTAIRNGAIDYLLKTEGESAILHAVDNAVDRLSEQREMEHSLAQAKQQLHSVQPMLQGQYLLQLLSGRKSEALLREKQFATLGIRLSADRPLLLVIGCVDSWDESCSFADRSLLLYSIQNIAQEYLSNEGKVQIIIYDQSRFIIFLQANEEEIGIRDNRLQDLLDSIQVCCKRLLSLSVSFILSADEIGWEKIDGYFAQMCLALNRGIGKEMILSFTNKSTQTWDDMESRVKMNMMEFMEEKMEMGDFETFSRLYLTMVDAFIRRTDTFTYEFHCRMVGLFFTFVNRWGFNHHSAPIDFRELLDFQYQNKEHSFLKLLEQFEWLFRSRKDEREQQTNEIVVKLHAYIDEHLSGDLSLQALSEVVYLNPYYLSRLYKQITGQMLKESIMEKRMDKALELLRTTEDQIQSIAKYIGFESNAYFNRFFKKKMNMTPLEYREGAKKSK